MNLEGITLHSLTAYLKQEVTGSRIYKIGMPSNHMVYFSLKRESDTIHFIIDVNPASPAIRLTTEAPDNPQEPPAFCMLLRKHLEEGRITRIRQYGLDRVIELEISLLGRSSQILTKQIIIELTGKNANLIFAENGKILDSLKHVSPYMNSVRVIQPGYAYNPPPPQPGLDILTVSPATIVAAIPDEVTSSLWKQLVKATTGIGKASALQLLSAANIPLSATYLTPMDRNRLISVITDLQKYLTEKNTTQPFTAIVTKRNQCQTISLMRLLMFRKTAILNFSPILMKHYVMQPGYSRQNCPSRKYYRKQFSPSYEKPIKKSAFCSRTCPFPTMRKGTVSWPTA